MSSRFSPGNGSVRRALGALLRVRELGLVVVLLVMGGIVAAYEPRFLDRTNLEQVALSATLVCIVALGQALVIIARQIDLSVGAIVALSAFVAAGWLERNPQGSLVIVFVIGCSVGTALGVGNALLVAVARIPAIVATLGTLAIYRGVAIVIAEGRQISSTVLPESYQNVAQAHFAGLPALIWLALLLTLLFGWMARYTRLGRNLYALGSSPQSARFAGLSETAGIAFVFVLSGFLCGLVGVLWGARFGTVDAVIARGLNLEVISAVVVGGVSIFGGSGTVYGAALGAVIFALLQNGVQLLHVNQFWIEAVIGIAILGTVVFYVTLARRTENAQRKARQVAGRAPSRRPEAGGAR